MNLRLLALIVLSHSPFRSFGGCGVSLGLLVLRFVSLVALVGLALLPTRQCGLDLALGNVRHTLESLHALRVE